MNYFRFICIGLCGVLSQVGARAQDATIAAPLIGFVHEAKSASLRPVMGIPGASLIGPALELPWPAAQAVASPNGHVMVLAGDGSGVWVVSGKRMVRVPTSATHPDFIALSPTGTAAAIGSKEDKLIEVVTGLPDQPVVIRRIDLQTFVTTNALAISDDGAWLLAASGDGVYLSNPSGQMERIGEAARSLSFRPRSHEFAITLNDELVVWRSGDASFQRQWSQPDGVHSAIAAQFSSDGRQLWIANADGSLLVLDRNGRKETGLCSCKPDGLQALSNGAVALTGFTRTSASNSPMLATSDATGLNVFFVPAAEHVGGVHTGDDNR